MNNSFIRKTLISIILLLMAVVVTAGNQTDKQEMVVYKSPTCGCCGNWIKHVDAAGFKTSVHNRSNLNAIKQKYGTNPKLQSCHTAVIEGYFVEGHVPAEVIRRLLSERPDGAVGLTAPGMPIGSPGMEVGTRKDPYDVLLVMKNGETRVYEHFE